jgi:hypothetical protein
VSLKIKLLASFIACSVMVSGQDIRDLLPGQDALTGWKLSQEPRVYDGDGLFELIDGGSDIYLEYGFNQVISAQFTDPSQNNILAEVYEMEDGPSAYGIFSITQQSLPWTDSFGDISAVSDDYISFRKGKYYVNLSWSSRQHIEKPLIEKLAANIDERIPENGTFPELVLDFADAIANTRLIYLEGNLALSNFYYIDYKDIFGIDQAVASNGEGYARIISGYDSPARATEKLASAKESITGNKRFTDVVNSYQGFSCLDNKGNRILVRQVSEYLVILIGINKDISLTGIMDKMSLQIEDLSR